MTTNQPTADAEAMDEGEIKQAFRDGREIISALTDCMTKICFHDGDPYNQRTTMLSIAVGRNIINEIRRTHEILHDLAMLIDEDDYTLWSHGIAGELLRAGRISRKDYWDLYCQGWLIDNCNC